MSLEKLFIILFVITFSHSGRAVHHGFTITPSHFIEGVTNQLTFRCEIGHYVHAVSRVLVLQLSKVDKLSMATLATEQQSGNGPILVASSLRNRSSLEGKIDRSDLAGTYLQLTLTNPTASDSENASVDALLDHVTNLHDKIDHLNHYIIDSKHHNSMLQDRLTVLEGKHQNATHRSVSLEGEVERLTEDVRQLKSGLNEMSQNMTCPASCVKQMEIMESHLNVSTSLVKEEMVDLVLAPETKRIAFFASPMHTVTGLVALHHSQIIRFEDVTTNDGHGYDSTTGSFTAPTNGTYVFMLNIPIIDKDPTRQFNIALTVNFDQTLAQIENGPGKIPSSLTVVRHLAKGDAVSVYSFQLAGAQTNDKPMYSKYSSYFGGFLLYED